MVPNSIFIFPSFEHSERIYNEPFELTDKMFKQSHVLLLIHQSNPIQIMHNARVRRAIQNLKNCHTDAKSDHSLLKATRNKCAHDE